MKSSKQNLGKNFNKKTIALISIFLISFIINFFFISSISIQHHIPNNDIVQNPKDIFKNSNHWDLSSTPIFINDSASGVGAHNWTWAVNEDWCSGFGTWNDPFIIENVSINGNYENTPITICNSNKSFIIKNCDLSNSKFDLEYPDYVGGILLENVSNGKIIENNCSNNGGVGIILKNSQNCTIIQNNVNDNIRNGIELFYSKNCTIEENIINSNRIHGIDLFYSNNSIIFKNNISNSEVGHGIYGNTQNTTISENKLNTLEYGINFGGHNNIIKKNEFSNCSIGGIIIYPYTIGYKLDTESINNTIDDNIFSDIQNKGIEITYRVNKSLVKDNIIENSNYCGIIDYGNNSTLTNNTIISCKYGLFIDPYTNNGNYSDNTLDRCEFGIYFNGNGENQVIRNNELKMCGIFLNKENSLVDLTSYKIDTTNKVNDKPIYYFVNSSYLNSNNFTNPDSPGQIILINCNHSIVSNFKISNSSFSVLIFYSNNITLNNNIATNNTISSFFIYNTNNSYITNNCISANYDNGLTIEKSFNLSIEENQISENNNSGIYLSEDNCIMIKNNTIFNNIIHGIYFSDLCNNSDIINNTIINNHQIGINIKNSIKIDIINNSINQNTLCGINISFSENIILDNNIVSDLNCGININSVYNLLLENNIISENLIYGIKIIDSKEIDINSNIIENNPYYGIYISNTNTSSQIYNIYINNNIFKSNQFSIFLGLNTFNITIDSNIISTNIYGISLDNCINSTISNNNFTLNYIGITLLEDSGYNLIFLNEFYDNILQANDDGFFNKWDNGSIGNYWDDYIGYDLNRDGIGDDNYSISGKANSLDNYPIYKAPEEGNEPNPDPLGAILMIILNNLLSPFSILNASIIITCSICLYYLNRRKHYSKRFLGESKNDLNFESDDQTINQFINSDDLLEFSPAIQDHLISSLKLKELKKIDKLNIPVNEKNKFIEELTNLNPNERKKIIDEMLKSQKDDRR
ncbi:MAG: right-handed parallel beta-helix repeat-containing protein [Candidatus Lokiarchaeota archaeon]|nr:right-handed parallel beta-helix repeat-containing protein [Candidatus Lokiarchaeota archaeon]